jgi:hypothetical protein
MGHYGPEPGFELPACLNLLQVVHLAEFYALGTEMLSSGLRTRYNLLYHLKCGYMNAAVHGKACLLSQRIRICPLHCFLCWQLQLMIPAHCHYCCDILLRLRADG